MTLASTSGACGLPCMGGGVHPRHVREGGSGAHGFRDRCPVCGPLRVLPEVVAEMRARVASLSASREHLRRHMLPTGPCHCTTCLVHHERLGASAPSLADDLLRALDEIDKLRAELEQAREALGDAREQATWAQQELLDREASDAERDGLVRQVALLDAALAREAVRRMEDPPLLPGGLLRALPLLTLAPEHREALGRDVRDEWIDWATEQAAPKPSWLVPWEGLSEPDREVDRRIGERLFLRGICAGRDLLEAGQFLRRVLTCDEIPMADREIQPGLQIAVGRVVDAVERLGDIPPDREPPRSTEPATWQEREEADASVRRTEAITWLRRQVEALRGHSTSLRELRVYHSEADHHERLADCLETAIIDVMASR